jgi:selT/selW/selH-like putative selenoprotein
VLRQQAGVAAELIKGDGGIFEVRLDGAVIFSKKECGGRFPADTEILAVVWARQAGGV